MTRERLIPLGRLVNVHATHGELRLLPFNPDSTTLHPGMVVVLRNDGAEQERCIRALRPHKRFILLTLDACTSMTDAEQLVGFEVCVRAADLPPPGPNEAYHYELVGMTVVTTSGSELGTIAEVLSMASNDVCIVRGGEREQLIPLIADVVKRIDRETLRMVIEPLPGLLDE